MNLDEDNPSPDSSSALGNDMIEYVPEHRNDGGLPAPPQISPRNRASRRPHPVNDPEPPNEYQPQPSRQRLHMEYPAEPMNDAQYVPPTMNYTFVEPHRNQQAPPQYAQANIDDERHGRLAAALIPGYVPMPRHERPPSFYIAPSSTVRQRAPVITAERVNDLFDPEFYEDVYSDLTEHEYRDFVPLDVQRSGRRPDYRTYVPRDRLIHAVYPPVCESIIRAMEQAVETERQNAERIREQNREQNREPVREHVGEPNAQQNVSSDDEPIEIVQGLVIPPVIEEVYEQPLALTRGAVVSEYEQATNSRENENLTVTAAGSSSTVNEDFAVPGPSSRRDDEPVAGPSVRVQIPRAAALPVIGNRVYTPGGLTRVASDTSNSTTVDFGFDWHIEEPGFEHHSERITTHWHLNLVWDLRIKLQLNRYVVLVVKLKHCYPSNMMVRAAFAIIKKFRYNMTVMHFEHPKYKRVPDRSQAVLKWIVTRNEPLDFDIMRVAIKAQHQKDPLNEVLINQSLEELLDNNIHSDVKLVVRGKELKAHKSLLSNRSTKFSNLLEADPSQNVFHFDENPDSFSDLIRYMYSRKIEFRDNAAEMRELALKYEVYQLVPLCDEAIYRVSHDYIFYEIDQPEPR